MEMTKAPTVVQYKLGDASDVHGKCTEEVVIATETDQTLWSDCSLEAAQDEDGGSIWHQEADQAE